MSIIQIQNEKIKKRAIENLSSNDIKINKNNIKKNVESIKNSFDVGYPFSKPLNIKKNQNFNVDLYHSYFKLLEEDIDTMFKSKNKNFTDLQRINFNISNNRKIVKNKIKELKTQLNNFLNENQAKNIHDFNFEKVNDLEFLTEPYTDCYIDLENTIAYNDIKEFNIHSIKNLKFDIYAETLINNMEQINTIEKIYNNKEIDMFLFKAITKEEKKVSINIDITNESKDKNISELYLKIHSSDNVNVKLMINNNNEYIIQDTADIMSSTSFDINRKAEKIRIVLTKNFDYKENDMFYYDFFIENIIINNNTYKNENYIVTKPIDIKTDKFILDSVDKNSYSGNITYFYTIDKNVLDWIKVNKNDKISLPDSLLEQKVVNIDNTNDFGIKFGEKYIIDVLEISDKEMIEVLLGENLESIEFFTSSEDLTLYKNIFMNNTIDNFYFKSKVEDASISFQENPYLYLKTEQNFYVNDKCTLGLDVFNKADLIEQFDDSSIFTIDNIKVYLNEEEVIINNETPGYQKKIEVEGENKIRIFYKLKMNDLSMETNIGVNFKTAAYDFYSLTNGIYTKENNLKYLYGTKGVLDSNKKYNNFSLDTEGRVFIFSNPLDNILTEGKKFNIIINKKLKERKIRIMAKLIKEDFNEKNSIESMSVMEID